MMVKEITFTVKVKAIRTSTALVADEAAHIARYLSRHGYTTSIDVVSSGVEPAAPFESAKYVVYKRLCEEVRAAGRYWAIEYCSEPGDPAIRITEDFLHQSRLLGMLVIPDESGKRVRISCMCFTRGISKDVSIDAMTSTLIDAVSAHECEPWPG